MPKNIQNKKFRNNMLAKVCYILSINIKIKI